MKKLLIIDGNAIMHRAYHAYPPQLTTKDGEPINAVYGFFAMLIKVLEEVNPTHLIVCFDRAAPTFRKALYVGYQADRPQMESSLSNQFILMHEALDKIGIPIFEVDGYEADDLIGTLATQAKDKGLKINDKKEEIEVVILTGDRDLLQLVNSHTKVLAPIIGITKFILFDEPTVLEKYGVKPSQVADYKALVGDASDGYPGVMGIGPKTASNLLKTYETFESLYEHLGDLPEKTSQKLAIDAEQGALAKKLATIVKDAPIHLDLKKADVTLFTQDKVLSVFDGFGFNSIKQRVGVFPGTSRHPASQDKDKREQLGLI
jgi:DNA polymerase-1